jgi:hypothetical protein
MLKSPFNHFPPAVHNADKAYVAVKLDDPVAKVALHGW